MTSALQGRRALVTGGARGIGRAEALALADGGVHVALGYGRSADSAAQTVRDIEARGGRAFCLPADVTDPDAVAELVAAAADRLGGLDILVSNAGVEHFGDLGEITPAEFDAVFAVNTRGQFLAVQEAQRHMADGGRIICTSSVSASTAFPRHAVYSASKAAVEAMVACLALDLAPRGITINAVAPGATASDMATEYAADYDTDYAPTVMPMGRFAEPADIARVVRFLASPDAGWITGQTIRVAGGQ